jgi:tetratricopeptide (TPR) repeat protein
MAMRTFLIFVWLISSFAVCAQETTQSAEALLEEAIHQQNADNHREAIALFSKCLYLKADFVEAYSGRAASKERLKDLTGALTDLNSCLAIVPDQYEVLLSRGTLLFRLGRYTDAKVDFLKLLKLPSGETTSVFYRKSAHSEGTDRIITAQGSSRSQIFNYLGLIEVQLGNASQGVVFLDSAIKRNPTDADFYVNRALAKQACQDATASADFQKALAINPDHAIAKHNLAIQSAKRGSFVDTEKQLTAVIESDSTLYFPFVNRGYYRFMSGNYSGALSDYNQAIRLNNADPEVWLNRGLVNEKLHNLKGALADYTQAIELKEDLVKAWLNRGNVYMKQELYTDAIEDYSAAIIYQPNYGHAYFNRAIALYKKKLHEEACVDLQRAEKLGVVVDAKMKKSICK